MSIGLSFGVPTRGIPLKQKLVGTQSSLQDSEPLHNTPTSPHDRKLPSYLSLGGRKGGLYTPPLATFPPIHLPLPNWCLSTASTLAANRNSPPPPYPLSFCNPHPARTMQRQSTVIVSPHRPTSRAVTILSLRFTCDLSAFINHIATELFCASLTLSGKLWRTFSWAIFYFMNLRFEVINYDVLCR